jgi:hypothetical protein
MKVCVIKECLKEIEQLPPKIKDAIYFIHAFQKKSAKTPLKKKELRGCYEK